jgi:hypothetical protein
MARLSATEVVANQKAHQHYAAVRAMHRVASSDEWITASLHALGREVREAGQQKQEPSEIGVSKGSTAPRSGWTDGRAAGAQCDTKSRP